MSESADAPEPPIAYWPGFNHAEPDAPGYAAMINSLRGFLDTLAGARPDAATIAALDVAFAGWTERLGGFAVDERDQLFGRLNSTPGRGQVIVPTFFTETIDRQGISGTVSFGRPYLGGNGAVHGGILPLLFDEVLGRLASVGRTMARTAYIKVDFRKITPLEKPLRLTGWFADEEGRKRLLRGALHHGGTLCAEAEALFVALLPGQP